MIVSVLRYILLASLLVAACGEDKDEEPAEGAKAPVAASTLSPIRFDRSAYCKKVLPVKEVAKHFGGLDLEERAKLLGPARLVECMYRSRGKVVDEHGISHPKADIKLRVDCRGLESNIARMRRLVKAALGGDKSSYRDVDYGRGGGYIRGRVRLGKSGGSRYHQVRFLHDTLPCSFTVLLAYVEEDKTGELARLLLERVKATELPQ